MVEELFMSFSAIILAGGSGKRMESPIPKVLHKYCGIPMIIRIAQCILKLKPDFIYIVVGKYRSQIENMIVKHFPMYMFIFVDQYEPLGTGHAVQQVLPYLPSNTKVLIVNGDTPNLIPSVLQPVIESSVNSVVALTLKNPTNYGRIITNLNGNAIKIVEENDATDDVKSIQQVNTGVYFFDTNALQTCLPLLKSHNSQSEFYLTDLITLCFRKNIPVQVHAVPEHNQKFFLGVNTRADLESLQKL